MFLAFLAQRAARVTAMLGIITGLLASVVLAAPVQAHGQVHASHGSHTWYVETGSQSHDGAIMGMLFLPSTITIDAGDTITWRANSAEPHTVTFNAPPGTPFNPFQPALGDGGSFDGTGYVTSGSMATAPESVAGFPTEQTYSLTFTTPGTYSYLCLVHPGMVGTVNVNPAGTAYPESQRGYDSANRVQEAHIIGAGYRLMGHEIAESAQSGGHTVFAGGTDTQAGADIMRFLQSTVVVHVGQTVTFENTSMAPHTVTFGTEDATVNGCVPDAPSCTYGTPTNYQGGNLNSGWFFHGQSFTVTFTKAGTYHYFCALHDYMGMKGEVIVVP